MRFIFLKIIDLVRENQKSRLNSLNMIASENVLSPNVKEALATLNARYHAEFYAGTEIFQTIYNETSELAKKVFKSNEALISPLSGNMAVIATLFAYSSPGDKVAILPLVPAGGYPFRLEYFNRKRIDIPFKIEDFNIDENKCIEILEKEKPRLVFLGSSLILFPQPISSITEIVHSYGGKVAYDGSHVLGLIAGGQFQAPLNDQVDLLIGSTHKSFPGPQGGIILSNNPIEPELEETIGIDPLKGIVLVDNIHNSRIAALGVALEEFLSYGKDYAKQVVANSKALAYSLDSNNIELLGKIKGFSESHQVLMKIRNFSEGAELRDLLFRFRIITDAAMRFGTAELTRRGFEEDQMRKVGEIIAEILNNAAKFKSSSVDGNLHTIHQKIEILINQQMEVTSQE